MTEGQPLTVRFGDSYISVFDLFELLLIPAFVVALGWWFVLGSLSGAAFYVGAAVLSLPSLWVFVMSLNAIIALLTVVRNLLAALLAIALEIVTFGHY